RVDAAFAYAGTYLIGQLDRVGYRRHLQLLEALVTRHSAASRAIWLVPDANLWTSASRDRRAVGPKHYRTVFFVESRCPASYPTSCRRWRMRSSRTTISSLVRRCLLAW